MGMWVLEDRVMESVPGTVHLEAGMLETNNIKALLDTLMIRNDLKLPQLTPSD
jgi:hypothetical protein